MGDSTEPDPLSLSPTARRSDEYLSTGLHPWLYAWTRYAGESNKASSQISKMMEPVSDSVLSPFPARLDDVCLFFVGESVVARDPVAKVLHAGGVARRVEKFARLFVGVVFRFPFADHLCQSFLSLLGGYAA